MEKRARERRAVRKALAEKKARAAREAAERGETMIETGAAPKVGGGRGGAGGGGRLSAFGNTFSIGTSTGKKQLNTWIENLLVRCSDYSAKGRTIAEEAGQRAPSSTKFDQFILGGRCDLQKIQTPANCQYHCFWLRFSILTTDGL